MTRGRAAFIGSVLMLLAAEPSATAETLTTFAPVSSGPGSAAPIGGARALYLLRCGGCHGIQGVSVPKSIPTLRGRAGVFLCSAETRDFVLRLPNIQMSLIRNDGDLANVMNFVMFDLGGASVPAGARSFTAAEIAKARGRPLRADTLEAQRDRLIEQAGVCGTAYKSAPPHDEGRY